jgi:plastocyanin
MRKRLPLAATMLAAILTLSACGGGSGSGSSASEKGSDTTEAPSSGNASAGGATEVEIADFAFDPGDLDVKVGDTVTFANGDSATHTATSDKGAPKAFDTGKIKGDASAEVTFDEAGDYAYYCSIHDYMKGTIHVME